MFKYSFKKLTLLSLVAVFAVIFSYKLNPSSTPRKSLSSHQALVNNIEKDLSRKISGKLKSVFVTKEFPFEIKIDAVVENLGAGDKVYVESIGVGSERKITLSEWAKIKTLSKVFLKKSNLQSPSKRTRIYKYTVNRASFFTNKKWAGALVVMSFGLCITILVWIIHSQLHRNYVKKLLVANKVRLAKEEDRCKATPYAAEALSGKQVSSKEHVQNWRILIASLRSKEESLGVKNSLTPLEVKHK